MKRGYQLSATSHVLRVTRHVLRILLSTCFLLLMLWSQRAVAQTRPVINHDISTGHLVIDIPQYGYDYVVTGTTNQYQIIVGAYYQGTITLSNVNITSALVENTFNNVLCGNGTYVVKTASCMAVMGLNGSGPDGSVTQKTNLNPVTKVNIVIAGDNLLYYPAGTSGEAGPGAYCAIQVDQGAQVNISAIDPCDNNSGSLFARSTSYTPGGAGTSSSIGGSAGIGAVSLNRNAYNSQQGSSFPLTGADCTTARPYSCGGNVVISSGNVTAWGGHAAGIGGSHYNYYDGVVLIVGGNVESRGSTHAAGVGSGCPTGAGVIKCTTQNSTIIALPPSKIEAYGAEGSAGQLASKGLAGTRFITYLGDPNKPLITIRTANYEPNADIYIDFSNDPFISSTFATVFPEFQIDKIWIGRTDATGLFQINGWFQNPVRVFTDASSTSLGSAGRPFTDVTATTYEDTIGGRENDPIILPLLDVDININRVYSIPLCADYSQDEADVHASHITLENSDSRSFEVLWDMKPDTDFDLVFFDENEVQIPMPDYIGSGEVINFSTPLKTGRAENLYSEMLNISLVMGSDTITFALNLLQRVGCTSFDVLAKASPAYFAVCKGEEVKLQLFMTLPDPVGGCGKSEINPFYSYYNVSAEPNIEVVLADTSAKWTWLLYTETGDFPNTTSVPFVDSTMGKYYIHWYAESGEDGASGTFGPYEILDCSCSSYSMCSGSSVVFADLVRSQTKGAKLVFYQEDKTTPITEPFLTIEDPGLYLFYVQAEFNGCFSPMVWIAITVKNCDIRTQVLTCADSTVVDMRPYIDLCEGEDPLNFQIKLGSSGKTQLGATVHLTDTTMIYYWNTLGTDVLDFSVECDNKILPQPLTLAMNVLGCPCDSAVCVKTLPPPTPLPMNPLPIISDTRVESYAQPYGGILYDDGEMKFITHNYLSEGVSNGLLIFDDNLHLETTILFADNDETGSPASPTSGALAIADVDGDGFAEIFVIVGPDNSNAYLTCYHYNPVSKAWELKWSNDTTYISSKSAINIGDVNNNGNVLILADNKIFNAKTGVLLLELPINPKGEKPGDSNVRNLLADMRNNGRLDVVAGTAIYTLKISNYSGTFANSYFTLAELPAGSLIIGSDTYANDGYTSVADLDLDGHLDVIVTTSTNNMAYMYAWNPQTLALFGDPILVNSSDEFSSVACIGDVDGDDFPEVVVTYTNGMSCWKIDPFTKDEFISTPLWIRNDFVNADGSTGATMFDFNQDGKQEIVYRDEERLYIIDGETGATLDDLPCFSPTAVEYPIIVDAENSGNTKIIVSGGTSAGDVPDNIRLMMFSPAIPGDWAPARKAWNQYMYNVVNINNDLTVPRVQISTTTLFSNGKYIFNNFLSQQTLFDENGDLLWTLPNIVWTDDASRTTYSIVKGDSAIITGCIKNIGDAGLFNPIYVTFYKNDTTCDASHIMYVDSLNTTLRPGQDTCFRFVIKDIMANWPDVDSVWISINDKGMEGGCAYPFQPQCELDGRRPVRIVNCPVINIPTFYTDTRPTCGEPNGCIVFFPTGSTSGYEFQITPTPTHLLPPPAWNIYTDSIVCGLRSGVYNIRARDTLFRMCEPAQIMLELTVDSTNLQLVTRPVAAVTCSESDLTGKIFVASSGGVGAHTYSLEKWVGTSLVPVTPLVMNSAGDTILKLNAGSYVVTVTDAISCTRFNAVVINSGDATLNISLIDVMPTICEADMGSVTFNINSNSPYWYYLPGGELEGKFPAGNATFTMGGLGAMSDIIIAYNECMARDTLPFTIERSGTDNLFVSAVHTNVQEFCAGNEEPGSITLTITGGAPPYEYSYMFNGNTTAGVFYASGSDTTLTGLAVGTYSISVMDDDNCHFSVSSIKIGTDKAPELRIRSIYAGKQPSSCGACDGNIILFPEGGSGGYEYNIAPAPAYLIPPTAYLPYLDSLVVNLCAGSYTITVRDTNWRGCPTAARGPITLSDSSTLFVSLTPVPATDCGPTGALIVKVSGGTAVEYTYYLAGDPVATLTALPAGDTITGLVPGWYHIKVLSAGGCVAISEPVRITAPANMSVQMVNTHPTPCEAANGIATFSVTNLSSAAFTYSYELVGGSIWNVTTPLGKDSTRNHTILNLGAGTNYTIAVTNACGTATTTFDINNFEGELKASAVATSMKQFCDAAQELGTIRLTVADGTPPYKYTYILNGSTIAGIFYAALSTDTLFTGFTNGGYDIKVTDANGCVSDANNITVGIEYAPLVTITAVTAAPDTICAGGTSAITATWSAGYGDAKFQWQYKSGGTWANVNPGVPTGAVYSGANTPTLTVSNIKATGEYEYRLFVTMLVSNCEVISDSAVVTVLAKPTLAAAVAAPDTICAGGTSIITSSLTGGKGIPSFKWQYKNGGTWANVTPNVPAGALYAGDTTQTLTVSNITATGKHEYRLSVIMSVSGCDAVSDSTVVTVLAKPILAAAVATQDSICTGGTSSITSTLSGGYGDATLQWQYKNGGTWMPVASGNPIGAIYTGATTATLTISNITATGKYEYRRSVTMTGSYCDAISDSAILTVLAKPTLTAAVATPDTICTGGSSTITSALSGGYGDATLQWQYKNSGTWENVTLGVPTGALYSDADTPSLTVSDITATGEYEYRLSVTMTGSNCDAVSDSAVVTVLAKPTLAAAMATPDTICAGGTSTITSSNMSGGYGNATLQWQYKNSGTWAVVAPGVPAGALYTGATTQTLTVSDITATGEHEYRLSVTMTGSGCDAVSDSTILTVLAKPILTAAVATSDTICTGGTSVLNSNLTGGTGTPTFQWQYKNSGIWVPVASGTPTGALYTGANTSTLTVSDIAATGEYEYRLSVTMTGSGCDAVSDSAILTVLAKPILTAAVATPDTICTGGTSEITSTLSGGYGNATLQWQYKNSGTWEDVTPEHPTGALYADATTSTLTVSDITATGEHEYRLSVTMTGSGCDAVSDSAVVTVLAKPILTAAVATPDTICAGGTSEITSSLSGGYGNATLQWQYKNSGTWTPVASGVPAGALYSGANTQMLTVSDITATGEYEYRLSVTMTGSGCDAVSDSAVVTVLAKPILTVAVATPNTICAGGTSEITSTLSGGYGNATLQWQYKSSGTWAPVASGVPTGALYSGATTSTLTVSDITATGEHEYRLSVTMTGSGCDAVSDSAVLTVLAKPALTAAVAVNDTICAGGTSILTSNLTGGTGTPTFQWQYKNSGIWTNVAGVTPLSASYSNANTEILTVTGITATGNHEYHLSVIMTGSGCSAVSDSAIVTVNPLPPTPTINAPVCDPPPLLVGDPQTATITINAPVGGPYKYALAGGTENRPFQASPVFVAVPNGYYTITVKDTTTNCTETNATILINCNCPDPPELVLETKDTATCAKNTITIGGNYNYATGVTITSNGTGLVTSSASTPSFTIVYTPIDAEIGKTITIWVTTDIVVPCVAKIDSVKIRVDSVSVGGTVSSDQIICKNEIPDPLTLSGYVGNVLKWQYSDDNFGSDIHDIANTFTILTSTEMGSLSANRYYRAVVQSGVCDPTYSDTVLITTEICACVSEPEIVLATNKATTCVKNAITIDNNLFAGSATAIDIIKSNGAGTLAYTSASSSPFTIKYTPHSSDAGKIITITVISNNPSGAPCVPATATLNISVITEPAITLTSVIGTATQTLRVGGTLANIKYVTKNAVDVTVTNLPQGIHYTWLNDVITISGVPTDTGKFQYTITATGMCGTAVATGIIIVKEACPATVRDSVNYITYNVVELVGFCWYKENMYGAKYQDSTHIAFAKAYYSSFYPDSVQNTIDFGLLYTYEDLTGGTLCPAGWRLPTSEEWALLNIYDINDLRNPIYWLQPTNSTNLLNFDARGAGYFNGAIQRFEDLYGYTAWWSSDASLSNTTIALGAAINYYCSKIEIVEILKGNAISIRCLMDD